MPKKWKYHPDYSKLYPGVEITPEILAALRESDRKMKYMEYDLKTEQPVRDEDGFIIALRPGQEDSLERLMETDKQFMDDAPLPEQLLEAREEIEELYRCIALLSEDERTLIRALFVDKLTEQQYASKLGLCQKAINKRKHRILSKLKSSCQVELFGTQTPFSTA